MIRAANGAFAFVLMSLLAACGGDSTGTESPIGRSQGGWPSPDDPIVDNDGGEPVDPGTGTPGPAPTPTPTPTPTPGIANLGTLPEELAGLTWPESPRISREVTVESASELASAATTPGTRILVHGAVGGDVSINTNDIEIVADSATSLGTISIARSVARVRVQGGRYFAVRVAIPASFYPSVEYRPEWMAQDLAFENVTLSSGGDTAFEIRGRRIAITDSDVTAGRYSVWCGDTASFQSEDVILSDNVFRSAGPEATVRFVSVLRSATVGNTLSNTAKHNYRVHGVSDLNFAAHNVLVNTGVMFGRMSGDSINRLWFDDNVFHHTAPDLFNPDSAIRALRARRNVAYTNVWSQFYAGSVMPGWELGENVIEPYQPPPAP